MGKARIAMENVLWRAYGRDLAGYLHADNNRKVITGLYKTVCDMSERQATDAFAELLEEAETGLAGNPASLFSINRVKTRHTHTKKMR